ncbi:hypothetical protein O181_000739 [Austropuccinia psidii MF-1]|uniref:DNA polymerase n=1 Tax=Austropuccinia psidii MF-1 TaxID=1389203 RepID=A0A9Q3B959_9BASI|nr:hypothetical protein [Austropuccinia psidii MF-1]
MPLQSGKDRKEALASLKAARAGQKRDYKVPDGNDIYETVPEEVYDQIVKGRLAEDFIENDDDSGYVDQGVDEWENIPSEKPPKRSAKPASRQTQNEHRTKGERVIGGHITSSKPSSRSTNSSRAAPEPNIRGKAPLKDTTGLAAYRKTKDPAASEDFMKSLFDGLESNSTHTPASDSLRRNPRRPEQAPKAVEHSLDQKKRKSNLSAAEAYENSERITPRRTGAFAPSSPFSDLDAGQDFLEGQTFQRSSSPGIGGGMSSEGPDDLERNFKKPRMAHLRDELTGLDVDDFAGDMTSDIASEGLSSKELQTRNQDDVNFEEVPTLSVSELPCRSGSQDDVDEKTKPSYSHIAPVSHNSTNASTNVYLTPLQDPLSTKPVSKPKLQGLHWQEALQDLPTSSNTRSDAEANLQALIDDSEDKLEPFCDDQKNDESMDVDISETTEFLANIPRKNKTHKTPRMSKKALAKAAADKHLPKPTPVSAFDSETAVDAKTSPNTTNGESITEHGRRLKFFWLDFYEVAGDLYLFGKVFDQLSSKYVACCVIVENIERNLFVLPRSTIVDDDGLEVEPTEDDVYDEIEEVLKSHGIIEFKAKLVERKYCFEQRDIPQHSNKWHKVVYSYAKPPIPSQTTGRTFSKVFGTGTSAFELFLLKRKIMGPCWLDIKEAFPSSRPTPLSWCKLEVHVKDPKMISPFGDSDNTAPKETPPLNILSMSLRDVMNHKENKKEVVCATLRMWQDANLEDPTPIEQQPSIVKTFVRPLGAFPIGTHDACRRSMPIITPVKEEHMLLSVLLGTVNLYDPDIIVGYDLTGVALDVILHRMRDLKTAHWSRIGRLRREKLPSLRSGGFNNHLLTGRLICDLSSDGFKSMVTSTTWSLTELCQKHLQIAREDIDQDEIVNYFDSTSTKPNSLINFIKHCEADSYFQMALIHKVQYLSLTKQLTNLAGNNWSSTLHGGRAQRNEFILLHEFHRHKFICPDKLSFHDRKAKVKPATQGAEPEEPAKDATKASKKDTSYKGGLVFEPKRGLWDKFILVMDFNSLYPSIIQEFNIDFTTVDHSNHTMGDEESLPDLPPPTMKQGVLPKLIATLVNRRREVKKLMKAPDTPSSKIIQYDIKQMALKLTANSMYGCLGFEGSRFYARPLAALTTFKGREILTNTRDLAENCGLDVIYGDTDSVMINTNAIDLVMAKKIGADFKKVVNDRYKLLEIDIDAVFERMLLLQKKKYAALKIEEGTLAKTVEVKGLDMKRREFCKLAKDASQYILQQILSGLSTELVVEKIHEYLAQLGKDVKDGKKELEDFVIHKKLGKDPKDYPDAKSQPHVQVALRMKLKGNISPKAGYVVPYIFCIGEDGSSSSRSAQADKARHPDDLRRPDSPWKIDYDYYLSLQVLPPIERLCDPIEGTDRSRLAECLGLDPSHFKAIANSGLQAEREFHTLDSQIPDAERFKNVLPLSVRCRHCGEKSEFKGVQADTVGLISPTGLNCPNLVCKQPLGLPSMMIQLELQIRSCISKFYEAWLICNDPACRNRTRMMSVYGRKCLNMGCKGIMSYEYTDKMLYDQLLYFDSLFDPTKAEKKVKGASTAGTVANILRVNNKSLLALRSVVERHFKWNGRRFVAMDSLFSFVKV